MVLQALVPSVVSGMADPVFGSAPYLCSSLAILLRLYKGKAKRDLYWYLLTLNYDQTFKTLVLLQGLYPFSCLFLKVTSNIFLLMGIFGEKTRKH